MFFVYWIEDIFLLLGYRINCGFSEWCMPMGNENYLMEITCADTAEVFHVLYVRYRGQIRNMVSHDIHREEDIDDMVQIIFLNVFRWFERACGCSMFYSKLYSMASNSIKNYCCRAGGVKSGLLDVIDETDYSIEALSMFHEDSPEEICSAMETGMEIIRLIANLPPPLKKALLLREDEGMSYEEIAIKMGCPMGTVRSRIHRVRAQMRKILKKDQ